MLHSDATPPSVMVLFRFLTNLCISSIIIPLFGCSKQFHFILFPIYCLPLFLFLSWSTNNLKQGFWAWNWYWYWWETQPLSFTLMTTWSGLGLVIKLELPAGANNPNKQEHSSNSNTWLESQLWVAYKSIFTGVHNFTSNFAPCGGSSIKQPKQTKA